MLEISLSLKEMIKDNVDTLLVPETKLDNIYQIGQFSIYGYSTPYRLDRTSLGGRLFLSIREYIPSKMIKFKQVQNQFEEFFVKINLRKKKWLLLKSP